MHPFDLGYDKLRFCCGIWQSNGPQLAPLFPLCPEFLFFSLLIMGDHRIGCGKDVFGGAVIFLQLDHLCILKFLLEFQDIADISSAETVNALVIVSDYTEVLVFIRQHTDDLELYKVCILILIDHDVLELLLVGMKDMRVILKQLDGLP